MNRIKHFLIDNRNRIITIILCIILTFTYIDISAFKLDIVSAKDEVTGRLNEWIVDAVWANNETDYVIHSENPETIKPKITFKYYAEKTTRSYAPHEIQFIIDGIDDIARSGMITAETTTTQSDSKWDLLSTDVPGRYIFANRETVDANESVSGGFEIMWSVSSRICENNYHKDITPVFQLAQEGEEIVSTNLNELSFGYTSTSDYYYLDITSRKILATEYEKAAGIGSDGESTPYEEFSWYALESRFNQQSKARGLNYSDYFIEIKLQKEIVDEKTGETIKVPAFDDYDYSTIEIISNNNKRLKVKAYDLYDITNDEGDRDKIIYGYWEFTDRKGDLGTGIYNTYYGVPKEVNGESTEGVFVEATGYLDLLYHDEEEYIRLVDKKQDTNGIPDNITDTTSMTHTTYGFTYGEYGYWHTKKNERYEKVSSDYTKHTQPLYADRLLSTEIYNGVEIEFELRAGVYRSYGSSSGGLASNTDGNNRLLKNNTNDSLQISDILGQASAKGKPGTTKINGNQMSSSMGILKMAREPEIDPSTTRGDTLERNQGFYLIQGDDRIEVILADGTMRRLQDHEYEFASITVPKDSHNSDYTVYASETQFAKYDDVKKYQQIGEGNTSEEKVFRFPEGAEKKYRAVYVKMEDVKGTYETKIYTSVRFHLDSDAIYRDENGNPADKNGNTLPEGATPIHYASIFPEGNIVNYSYMRVLFEDKTNDNQLTDYLTVTINNYVGEHSVNVIAKDDLKYQRKYLYRSFSNVYIRKAITTLSSDTPAIKKNGKDDIKAITNLYGGGYAFLVTTNGSLEADNPGKMKKFSIHTLLPADLEPNQDLSAIRYNAPGVLSDDPYDGLLPGLVLEGSAVDTEGNIIDSEMLSRYVSYSIQKRSDGQTVVSAVFDFSDTPINIQKVTNVSITYPVRVDSVKYRTGNQEYTISSYTSIHDTGIDEIKGKNKDVVNDIHDIDSNPNTTLVADSTRVVKGDSSLYQWENAAYKSADSYLSDDYSRANIVIEDEKVIIDNHIQTFARINESDMPTDKTTYSYRMEMEIGNNIRNIVMYDNIEPFDKTYRSNTNQEIEVQSDWHGDLINVDTSYLRSLVTNTANPLDIDYTVFYSTEEIEDYAGISNGKVESGNWKRMICDTDKTSWTVPEKETGKARSIAVHIDTSKMPSGNISQNVMYVIINMHADTYQWKDEDGHEDKQYMSRNVYEITYDTDEDIPTFFLSGMTNVELRENLPIVTIRKSDKITGRNLSGAKFEIYEDKTTESDRSDGNYTKGGLIDSGVTDIMGCWTSYRMKYNVKYLLYETTSPQGYRQLEKPLEIMITDENKDEYEILVENDRIMGSVHLDKLDKDGGITGNIPETEYQLFKGDGQLMVLSYDSAEKRYYYDELASTGISTLVTDENGLNISELPWGNYYLQEKTAPRGFDINTDIIKFSIKSDSTSVDLTQKDEEKTASLMLKKLDAETGANLSNAWYKLEKQDSSGAWQTCKTNLSTNSSGEITVDGLKFGYYRFVEINPPVGYEMRGSTDDDNVALSKNAEHVKIYGVDEDQSINVYDYIDTNTGIITLNRDTIGLSIQANDENTRKKGSATIRKLNVDGTPLKGTKFNLYMVDEAGVGHLLKSGLTTDENGRIDSATGDDLGDGFYGVKDLDWGDYYFTEVYAPKGYILDTTHINFSVTAQNADQLQEFSIKDYQKNGSICLTKRAESETTVAGVTYQANDPLAGAVFRLVSKDNNILPVRQISQEEVDAAEAAGEKDVDLTWYVYDQTETNQTMITDKEGQIKIRNIPWGSYYMEEVQPPTGFAVADKVRFVVNSDTCYATQELDCYDPQMECEIIINKEIDARIDEFGTPTFLFKITDMKSQKTWTKSMTLAKDTMTGTTKISVPTGTYKVEELQVSRYNSDSISIGEESTSPNNIEKDVENKLFICELGTIKDPNTSIDVGDKAVLNFHNTLDKYNGLSHNANATNIIPKNRRVTGISLEYLEVVPVDNDEKDYPLDLNQLVGYLIYDDGEKMETAMTMEEKNNIVFEHGFYVSNSINDANTSKMLSAVYSYDGRKLRTMVDITVAPASVALTQKVIYKVDKDNSVYFMKNGKRVTTNSVYYSDGAAVIGSYLSPTFVDTDNSQAYLWADAPDLGNAIASNENGIITYLESHPEVKELTVYIKLGDLVIDFDAINKVQEFEVIQDGFYFLEGWGASSGSAMGDGKLSVNSIGKGAYTSGYIYLTAGTKLYIYVGGRGEDGALTKINAGGWNGGGGADHDHNDDESGAGGGGATDFRLSRDDDETVWNDMDSLMDRIMVAAGGGGASFHLRSKGGDGGKLEGLKGLTNEDPATESPSQPGTQTGGYKFGEGQTYYHKIFNCCSGGGGGGYYGATVVEYEGSEHKDTGAAGGSSFISGYTGCDAVAKELGADGNVVHTGKPVHYSGKTFINGIMIAGNEDMPVYEGASDVNGNAITGDTMTGNAGNGHARITFVGNEIELPYTGMTQSFTAPKSGYYKLEAWGAAGGTSMKSAADSYPVAYSSGLEVVEGGRGGYSSGLIYLKEGENIYYAVGGAGKTYMHTSYNNQVYYWDWLADKKENVTTAQAMPGGFNGGGEAQYINNEANADWYNGAGGGATHFARTSGELSALSGAKDSVLLVAGGGGGSTIYQNYASPNTYHYGQGGAGSGIESQGNYNNGVSDTYKPIINVTGSTNTSGGNGNANYTAGTFGKGGSYAGNNPWGTGGGGGYMGGASTRLQGAAGGSGYINNNYILNAKTVTGNSVNFTTTDGSVVEPTEIPTFTGAIVDDNKVVGYTSTDTTMIGNRGNGCAKITYVGTPGVINYDYTGQVQSFTAPKSGYYQLEAWGAQGGDAPQEDKPQYGYQKGGRGGYSYGTVYLTEEQTIYLAVGGEGMSEMVKRELTNHVLPGGYNGGGSTYGGNPDTYKMVAAGGGATHFALSLQGTGVLSAYETSQGDVLVVAGGGGGAFYDRYNNSNTWFVAYGGYGGGETGGEGKVVATGKDSHVDATIPGGTQQQQAPNKDYIYGTFGQGANAVNGSGDSGGGGGWYGGAKLGKSGKAKAEGMSGGGGSGHINEDKVTDGATIGGNNTFISPEGGTELGHSGNGYARVTYLYTPSE